ncbi:MAG TPA: murein biosynthesis integral membrane protein MurJ [Clostridiaceae bacterium]|nr:murein biosynthesis integral membrane protein MurJ [Clostridiaceae bacterium]
MINLNKSVRTASFMVTAAFLSKILGMLRDILVANTYGTSPEAVAFSSASRIPMYFFDIGLAAAVSSVFIPVFNEFLEKEDRQKALEFSNTFLNIVLLFSGIVTVLSFFGAYPIVRIIAGGLPRETFNLAVELAKIMFPIIIFAGMAFTFVGILQSYDEFNVPAAISLASNIIVILYLVFLNNRFGIYGLAFAMVAGWAAQAIIQIPSLFKKGYKYRPVLNLQNPGIKKAGLLFLPFLVSTWVQPVNAMVNIHLASWLNDGKAVVALDYANRVYIIVVGVFTYALSNLIFPSLSRTRASENNQQFEAIMKSSLRVVLYFITPLMAGFIVLREPIIRLIYERGAFDRYSTGLTATALLFYSVGMLGFAVQEIMNKAYFARQDARTPMKVSIGGIILNFVLSVVLSRYMGLSGIALAASITAIAMAVTFVSFMRKVCKGIVNRKLLGDSVKILIASILTGIIVNLLHTYFTQTFETSTIITKLIEVALPGSAGIVIYLTLTLIMGLEEAKLPLRFFKKDAR